MILQTLLYPNDSICTEFDLYFHIDGIGAFSKGDHSIHVNEFSWVRFDTFFNIFNVSKWSSDCRLDGLFLNLECDGKFEVRVIHSIRNRSWDILYSDISTYCEGKKRKIDLSHYLDGAGLGVIYVELRAWSEEARIISGDFSTNSTPAHEPTLAICITTFKREQEIRKTAQRLERFLSDAPQGENTHVFIIDNGQSADVPETKHITTITNPNYGGAGGFSRGLIEARDRGFSHCLFMDDDATFHMENLRRTYAYLALAKDDRTAISGAMISNAHKWAMHEYGAFFDGVCRPLFGGFDLRDANAVRHIEFSTTGEPHPNQYGGWWFFAFPIEHVKRYPFPFFVRGDDSNFSMENDFKIKNLNGVCSFQDDFSEKETPQVLYLDQRYHLVHRLVVENVAVQSPLPMLKVAAKNVLKNISRFHYDSAEAQIMALEDVLSGPKFFLENLDMSKRRADLKAITASEVWRPLSDPNVLKMPRHTEISSSFKIPASFKKRLYAFSLNGTVLPLPIKFSDIRLGVQDRGALDPVWGAKKVHVLSVDETQEYIVSKDRTRAFYLLKRFSKAAFDLWKNFGQIRAAYCKEYDAITSDVFWRKVLK